MDRAEVRPMEGRDRIQVEELERSCFSQPWSDKLLMETLESRFDTCFVYAEGERVLGYGVVRVIADEGEIQRIAVFPEYRRRGIAGKLMDAMVDHARSMGASCLSLEVRESNTGARNLYETYGFSQEAVRRGYYSNPTEDALIMWNREI